MNSFEKEWNGKGSPSARGAETAYSGGKAMTAARVPLTCVVLIRPRRTMMSLRAPGRALIPFIARKLVYPKVLRAFRVKVYSPPSTGSAVVRVSR